MSLIRKELNIFSGVYWLFAFFVCELPFISFAHFSVGLFIFILIDLYEFFVFFVKIFFVFLREGNYLFSVVWIANIMYILSFISWLHGICFHKSILILMWLNSFIFCFMETSMMGGKTQCWDYPLPCPAGPLWSQRVEWTEAETGWMDVCELCVHRLWVLGRVLGQPLPQTRDNTPFTCHFCKKRQPMGLIFTLTENFLSEASSPSLQSDHGDITTHHQVNELHNSDLQEIKLEFFVPFFLGIHCVPNYMGTNSSAISPRRNWGPLVLTEELVMSPWFFQNVLLQN